MSKNFCCAIRTAGRQLAESSHSFLQHSDAPPRLDHNAPDLYRTVGLPSQVNILYILLPPIMTVYIQGSISCMSRRSSCFFLHSFLQSASQSYPRVWQSTTQSSVYFPSDKPKFVPWLHCKVLSMNNVRVTNFLVMDNMQRFLEVAENRLRTDELMSWWALLCPPFPCLDCTVDLFVLK